MITNLSDIKQFNEQILLLFGGAKPTSVADGNEEEGETALQTFHQGMYL